jgi:hypothetical protein
MAYDVLTAQPAEKTITLPHFCQTYFQDKHPCNPVVAASYANAHLMAWVYGTGQSCYIQLSRRNRKTLLLSMTDLHGLQNQFAPATQLVTLAVTHRNAQMQLCFHN